MIQIMHLLNASILAGAKSYKYENHAVLFARILKIIRAKTKQNYLDD